MCAAVDPGLIGRAVQGARDEGTKMNCFGWQMATILSNEGWCLLVAFAKHHGNGIDFTLQSAICL